MHVVCNIIIIYITGRTSLKVSSSQLANIAIGAPVIVRGEIKLSIQSKLFISCACGRNCVAMMQLVFYSIQTEFSWNERADLKIIFFELILDEN